MKARPGREGCGDEVGKSPTAGVLTPLADSAPVRSALDALDLR